MSNIRNLGEFADAAKGAADRAAEAIDDALNFVEKSNLRIAALEKVPLQKMTLTEFLAWEEHQTERHEFFDGETFAMVGGTARHNRVILNLDSRPDRWGERVIRNLYKPARLSVLEYLYFGGENRFGALGVSLDPANYQPSSDGVMARLANLGEMERAIAAILAGEKLSEALIRLVKPGPSFGGARPKSLIEMEGVQWVVKFSEGEDFNTELVEHAAMRLAALCGMDVAETRALPLPRGHAVAVKRFDRSGAQRSHVISANTVLRAAGLPMGYPELAQSMRRIARAEAIRAHQKELFRRMVFNILMDNTDDHEKNHAFVRAEDGFYDLSPAYDVVPSVQGLSQQQLRVGKGEAESSIENALSEVHAFGLTKDSAVEVIKRVVAAVDGWKENFRALGVKERDLEMMAQYIDGPLLKAQRAAFSKQKSIGISK